MNMKEVVVKVLTGLAGTVLAWLITGVAKAFGVPARAAAGIGAGAVAYILAR